MEQDIKAIEQNKSFIKEIQELNQKSSDPNYQTFKKSTYWHKQNTNFDSMENEDFKRELVESLQKIETKLAQIEALLKK